MKCPKCKKDFYRGVKAAYKLGFKDGQKRYERALELLEKTNHYLFDGLKTLDKDYPIGANSAFVSRVVLEHWRNKFTKLGDKLLAWEIQKLINEQMGVEKTEEAELRKVIGKIDDLIS